MTSDYTYVIGEVTAEYLRNLKRTNQGTKIPCNSATRVNNMPPHQNTRRWRRLQVDLPIQLYVRNGDSQIVVPGRATEISEGGMGFCAGIDLNPGDLLEVQFEEPGTRVMGVIRSRAAYSFGLEFLSPLAV